jgi:hypothetical protein
MLAGCPELDVGALFGVSGRKPVKIGAVKSLWRPVAI